MRRLKYILLAGLIIFEISCKKDNEINIVPDTALELQVFNLINEYRNSQGLPILAINDTITQECRIHSYNMANGIVNFGHDGFDNRSNKLLTELSANGIAENVALGYITAENVVEGWLNSSGHKENIEGDFTLTGIGVVNDAEGVPYFTQIFIKIP